MISIFIVTLSETKGFRREAAGFSPALACGASVASLRMTWYGA